MTSTSGRTPSSPRGTFPAPATSSSAPCLMLSSASTAIAHTVIGPGGVFAVETKNWNGRMWKVDGDKLIHNGVDETGSVLQVLAEAKELRRRLDSGHVSVRWVQALLVSAKSTLPDVRVEFKYVTLIGASDLVPFIRDRPRVLSDSEVASAVTALTHVGGHER